MERPASSLWLSESNRVFDEEVAFQERFNAPETRIPILRLTSQPCINHHIYPEAPISTPDGKRFIFARSLPLGGITTFWIADVETLKVRQITDEAGAGAPVVTPDGKWFYYSVGRVIRRMSPETFEREECFVIPAELSWVGGISSVDYSGTRFLAAARGPSGLYGVAMVDLAKQRASMIYEGKDARNAHPQYSHNADRQVMVQVNDGIALDEHGNIVRLVGDNGASLHVLNDDGSGCVRLNVGSSPLERVQGHECWVGDTNKVITTLHRRESISSPWIQDRIAVIAPGDKTYRIVGEGEGFTHIHTTPDGRFWISDCNRTAKVFVGSVATGRYRLLCNSGATFGSAQYAHPHPFFLLGDGKTVGWNSDVTGVPHVYCAHIPEGFLEALE
ncbi:MAG: PD40 domain-containing protein [Anaerolineae bacterium]|nr:PD40 domain-containing protein [Anaerolineae bacterium]